MPTGPAQAQDPRPSDCRTTKTPPRESSIPTRLKTILGELGPALRPGHALEIAQQNQGPVLHHCSGLPALDTLLGGGFARGQLSEIVGPAGSGRTSLLLSLLAQTTSGSGELAAVVDRADAFDPLSAEIAGVDLARVLWVRVGEVREALRSTEHLLETEGLPLVLLDLDTPEPHGPGRFSSRCVSVSAWTRLARLAAGTGSALVVLSHKRQVGHLARTVLELQPAGSHFHGSPPLLAQFESRAILLRHPLGPLDPSAKILLGGRSAGGHLPSRP